MPKPRAGPLISPRNHKISHLFNKQTVEDQDPIALRDLSDAAVRTVVGACPAGATMVVGPTIVVMAGAGDIGAGAIVGGKPELLGVREAASVGGLFRSSSSLRLRSNASTRRFAPNAAPFLTLDGRLSCLCFTFRSLRVSTSVVLYIFKFDPMVVSNF
jgi:hypothetical protein